MKKIKVFTLFIVMMIVFCLSVSASDIDIGGTLEEDLIYYNDKSETLAVSKIILDIEKDYGFDKHLYLNPEFRYTYSDNVDFSEFSLEEGYLDLYLADADLRIGRQYINWGMAYELNPTDMVNPIDYTAEDPLDAQQAVDAINLKYYFNNNMELSTVLIAGFVAGEVSDDVKQFNIRKAVGAILKENPSAINPYNPDLLPAVEPEIDSFSNAEYALNLSRRNINGFDLSLSYFKGYEDTATLSTDLDEIIQGRESQLVYSYKETQALGFNAVGSVGQFGAWSEANYAYNEDEEKTFDIVVGSDYTFENNLYTVAQLFHREHHDYQLPPEDINYLICYADKPYRQIHKWETTLVYDLDNNEFLINPQLNISLANNLKLNMGIAINSNLRELADDSLLKILGEEKSYLELVYNF